MQVRFDDGADDEEQAEVAVDGELLALQNPGHLQPGQHAGEQHAQKPGDTTEIEAADDQGDQDDGDDHAGA